MSKQNTPSHSTASGRARLLPVVIAFAILAVGSMVATQRLASALSYQAALGEPITRLFGIGIYQPLGWLKWFFAFRTIEHPVLDAAFAAAAQTIGAAFLLAAAAAIFMRYLLTRDLQTVKPDLHGTAHWMTSEDIKASGLIGTGEGVYIGAWTEKVPRAILGVIKWATKLVHYLRHNGPEHILVFAPTRSGKGVGLVLPTLLSWMHSALIYDIKGEAWALTSGWRKQAGHRVLRFDPADPSGTGVCYNPLEEIRLGTVREVGDVQNLVTMIVDPDGKGLNDHWAKTGHALLVGAVLHVLYSRTNKTLAGVAEFLSDPACAFEETLGAMLETEHDENGTKGWVDSAGESTLVHPVVASSARDMLNKADNERSGVLSTAMSFLSLYRDPIVAMNTRGSEFKVADLMNHEFPVSLYVVVRPSDQARLKPLTRLLINQIVRGLTEEMKFKDGRSVALYKHRLLLLMDEFPSLGKLEIFEEALAFMAGYGMKAYLITQDLAQLQKHYGRDEAITSNCHTRVAFAPNKYDTAKMLSDMVGTTTVVKSTYSYSGKRSKTTLDSVSAQASEHARQLLTPDEIMRLRGPKKDKNGNITEAGDMLIFQAGSPPIMGTQILYFLDPTFNERSLVEPPSESDRLRTDPAQPFPIAVLAPTPPAQGATLPPPAEAGDLAPDEEASDADEYETPPLTDEALIHDDEEFPGAYEVPIDPEEEDPPLGRELTLTPEELAAIPDDPETDSEELSDDVAEHDGDDSSPPGSMGNDPSASTAPLPGEDPFLAMSRQWLDETTLDIPPLDAEPPTDDDSPELADGRDPFLAASIGWAGPRPPDTSSFGFNFPVSASASAAVATAAPSHDAVEALSADSGAGESVPDTDSYDAFDVLTAMAQSSTSNNP
ncbi:type IV secretory system conjugative DNA transfer family protein [Xanthomonas campestris pv. campestris]|uniref:type IV secretory system conjugative DNA transfer family protein n=1 Tax=Xanthomonas campestris TaxID=339 RepID=UPI002E77141E|nr:type IV secretory system conjugative DNA transfer family protein [Xanthomonas campestris]MCD0253106.1 type IV secretory system conjugative DNA transfer family protein [Xanthomonas campestris pv. campestris]